jgi:farnesyl diphosphate synthase
MPDNSTNNPPARPLKFALKEAKDRVDELMKDMIPPIETDDAVLRDAMRYAVLAGGKRLRPFLAITTARMFGVDDARSIRVGAAIEFVHTYSLIQDDLPCMDDAQTRRGETCTHLKFDEATAILASDGLQALAFDILSDQRTHDNPHIRCDLINRLAKAIGANGLVGGQMLDLIGETQQFDIGKINRMQRKKTGALIEFATVSGAVLSQSSSRMILALRNYAHDIGLTFQITDDILDVEGDAKKMGKGTGQDEQASKSNYVETLGLEKARQQADILTEQAIRHLSVFGQRADILRDLAKFIRDREH